MLGAASFDRELGKAHPAIVEKAHSATVEKARGPTGVGFGEALTGMSRKAFPVSLP